MSTQTLTWLLITVVASVESIVALAIGGRDLWRMYSSNRNGSRRQLAILFFFVMLFLFNTSLLLLLFSVDALIHPVVLKTTPLFVIGSSLLLGQPVTIIVLVTLGLVYRASFLEIGDKADSKPHRFDELQRGEKKMKVGLAVTFAS